MGTALDELERTGKSTALTTLCVASGMGASTIIEKFNREIMCSDFTKKIDKNNIAVIT